MAPTYPRAERQPIVDDLHGLLVPDPYRWLEDPSLPETREWLAAQDELWRQHQRVLPGLGSLRARVARLTEVGAITAPVWRGDRRFFLRQTAGQEHPVLYVAGPDGRERALVDPMALAGDGSVSLDRWQPDGDGRLLAYQVSRHGTEQAELYVLDVDTRRVVDGPIDRCRYSPVAWLPGGTAFYYVRAGTRDDGNRRGVYLHEIGTAADGDRMIAGPAPDDGGSYGLGISWDGRWLVVSATSGSARSNDLWLADLSTSSWAHPRLRVVQQGIDARTVVDVGLDGRLYVVTDLDAPNGRLCVGDPGRPEPEVWRDLVPAEPDAVLADFAVLDGPELARPVLLAARTRHALGEITVHDLRTGDRLAEVPLPGPGTIGPLSARPAGGHEVWFTYTDHLTPSTVYRYDARTGETTRWAAAPGAVTAPDVDGHRIVYPSADGTPVRMVVLAGRGHSGPRPAILYGYGGFGVPLTPSYSSFTLAWVEAGGVFAIANLRGGGEEGEQWHRAGALDHKQNVFDDFVAAAERLIADGWTTGDQLGICGESNGGLLVGAALTQRPDLFAAALCSAPVLDMVRYERFGLGPAWRGEYGTADDPDQLRCLLSYSPYHRVRPGERYPAVLFTVFGDDTRVDPLHAYKMCAALQWATASDRPVLIRHEDGAGHGASPASRRVALAADMLAFAAAHTGLDLSAR
ncbi:S9 family peptidase [Jiangella aurantiaca]|uniref:prolyl oligopeptidase n=1 Tax=Jiangella aurantiaca TaxID=2530373 RepID=A0A4R5AJD4_9ACTN|nr:S9 family peptidase [Jiangella aurantiaca]